MFVTSHVFIINSVKGGSGYSDIICWFLKFCFEASSLAFSSLPSWFQITWCDKGGMADHETPCSLADLSQACESIEIYKTTSFFSQYDLKWATKLHRSYVHVLYHLWFLCITSTTSVQHEFLLSETKLSNYSSTTSVHNKLALCWRGVVTICTARLPGHPFLLS